LFHVSQKLIIDNDKIDCKNSLIEPVKDIGLQLFEQDTFIQRDFQNKTLIELKAIMKIKRFIPFFLKDYAQKKLDHAASNQIENLKNSIMDFSKNDSKNISIKIK
jgi:hypothetical protein